MRVLVTGAAGQVGHELMRQAPAGFNVSGFDSSQLDITSIELVRQAVDRVRPNLIINAAAYTAVDKAETDQEHAWAVNQTGVANLAAAAVALDVPVLHISTDYVFDGTASTPYLETDSPGPTGVYGNSKLAGEQSLERLCDKHVVLRTSWVFAAHGNNFVRTMLRLAAQHDSLSIVADQRGGPTSAASIAAALWQLAQQYRDKGDLPWGVYHYSGTPACSWFEFAEEIFTQACTLGMLEKTPAVNPITTAEYPTPARRPAWSVMDCSKLEQYCGIRPAPWKDELQKVLKELGAS
ncbi:dTDP-4-dehydrorhamnose reductase [Halopseudomonas pachastrellae]|uniref:dTDP-4-dehydrorhamnose reductase n=1 Tax=Halopseudomonas pachastrellae TaxID=254161 RepID=UPI003D7D56EC